MVICQASDLWNLAKERVKPAEIIADIGCGIRPQTLIHAKVWLAIDPHQAYLERLASKWSKSGSLIAMHMPWATAVDVLQPGSVDTVFLLDVVEHLEREDVMVAMDRTKAIVRQQIVVFTPLGFMPQDPPLDEPDPWGMDGHKWQKHRSGWMPEDFWGWEILVSEEFHYEDHKQRPLPRKYGAFFAIWTKP